MNPKKLFENYFDNEQITTPRLVAFGVDHLNRMTQANGGSSDYSAMMQDITGILQDAGIELTGIEGNLRTQIGLTQTADEVMDSLKDYMREHEDELRYKLKGQPGAIIAFYPQDNRAVYNKLTKERMPVLTGALAQAATTYAGPLGSPLSTELQAFATRWQAASDAQEQAMGGVSQAREKRDLLRPQLENILMRHVHRIGFMFIGDPDSAMALFNFSLLWYRGERPGSDNDEDDDQPVVL